jgi:hypothetical protein
MGMAYKTNEGEEKCIYEYITGGKAKRKVITRKEKT